MTAAVIEMAKTYCQYVSKKSPRIAIARRTALGARAPVMARIRPLDIPDFCLRKETLRPP